MVSGFMQALKSCDQIHQQQTEKLNVNLCDISWSTTCDLPLVDITPSQRWQVSTEAYVFNTIAHGHETS